MVPTRTEMEQYQYLLAFCDRVRTLEIQSGSLAKADERDRIASFVTLFSRINYFRWNGAVAPKHMRTIMPVCLELSELHLLRVESYPDGQSNELLRVFEIAQGRLCTPRIKSAISGKLVRSLGQTKSDLHTYSAEIGPENVAALLPLPSTHHRKLRSLDVNIFNPDDQERCLRSEGWHSFAEAVESASAELMDVIVECGSEYDPFEPDFNDLVDSIASILQRSLKGPARIVRFHVIVRGDGIWRHDACSAPVARNCSEELPQSGGIKLQIWCRRS